MMIFQFHFAVYVQYSEAILGLKILQKKHDPIKSVMCLSDLAWDCGTAPKSEQGYRAELFPSHLEFPQSPASLKSQCQRKGNLRLLGFYFVRILSWECEWAVFWFLFKQCDWGILQGRLEKKAAAPLLLVSIVVWGDVSRGWKLYHACSFVFFKIQWDWDIVPLEVSDNLVLNSFKHL